MIPFPLDFSPNGAGALQEMEEIHRSMGKGMSSAAGKKRERRARVEGDKNNEKLSCHGPGLHDGKGTDNRSIRILTAI